MVCYIGSVFWCRFEIHGGSVLLLVLMNLRIFAYCLLNLCERYTALVKVKHIKIIIILKTQILQLIELMGK